MVEGLPAALLVTLVGMVLVFGAILVFWLLLVLLNRGTGTREAGSRTESSLGGPEDRDLKCRAALAAVSVALIMEAEDGPGRFPLPPTALVSTWQSVMRARLLSQRRSVR